MPRISHHPRDSDEGRRRALEIKRDAREGLQRYADGMAPDSLSGEQRQAARRGPHAGAWGQIEMAMVERRRTRATAEAWSWDPYVPAVWRICEF